MDRDTRVTLGVPVTVDDLRIGRVTLSVEDTLEIKFNRDDAREVAGLLRALADAIEDSDP